MVFFAFAFVFAWLFLGVVATEFSGLSDGAKEYNMRMLSYTTMVFVFLSMVFLAIDLVAK